MGGDRIYPSARLGEILNFKPRNGYSPKEVSEWTGLLSLGLGCLTVAGFSPRQLKIVPNSSRGQQFLLGDGDLLISRANTRELVGLVGVYQDVGTPCIYPDLMMRLVPDESLCVPSYLELILKTPAIRKELQAGARGTSESMVKISSSLVQSLQVPLPNLDEQRRIVAAHAVVERRIAALERVRAKLREAGHALFSSALNSFDVSQRISLGYLLEGIQAGWSPACDASPPGADQWGVVRVSAVTSGEFNPNEAKRLPHTLSPRPELEISSGDVLVARANGARSLVGVACHVKETRSKLMLSDKILRLVPDESVVNSKFLSLLFSSPLVRSQIEALLNGSSGQNNISQGDIRKLLVPDVPLKDQCKIIDAHAAQDARFSSLGRQIAKLRVVRQGLVEDLVTGRAFA
ncbi:hypothetical protein [Streptomyces sp. NPDC048277]|uniref:restriction endonuclease subunit S n=1 Tax=Streptomyces sp. NPDC048277 TaxID=3155027 RepID=UPI0033D36576